jgi:hypothetical protein
MAIVPMVIVGGLACDGSVWSGVSAAYGSLRRQVVPAILASTWFHGFL